MGAVGRPFAVGQAAAPPTIRILSLSFPWHLGTSPAWRAGFDNQGRLSPWSPGIVLGHNASIGWGFHDHQPRQPDVFIERVDSDRSNRYITPDGARPFPVRERRSTVLWGAAGPSQGAQHAPRRGDRRFHRPSPRTSRRPGPRARPAGHGARRRRHLDRRLMRSRWRKTGTTSSAPRAGQSARCRTSSTPTPRNGRPDRAGARADPAQRATARCPRRAGRANTTGGFVPFDELPRAYNPPSGIIVNATPDLVPRTTGISSPRLGAGPTGRCAPNQLLREV